MVYKEYESDDEVIGNSNIHLILKKRLKEKMDCLSNYDKTEVGGFITYEKIEKDEDGDVTIVLDDILIPPQEATSGDVDVDGQGQVELRKEYGERCLKIIGHFHSHRSMGCFFSSTDESMMKSYSENKNFRIFIVGSKGEHLIRLVLKNSVNEIPFEVAIENVEYEVEEDDTIKNEMEDEIRRKVKEPVKTTTTYYSNSSSNSKELKAIKKEIELRVKYLQHQNHKVKVEKLYKEYADLVAGEFKILNPVIELGDVLKEAQHYNVVVELGDKNKAKEFMVDVKQFLMKTILLKKEKREAMKEVTINESVLKGEELEDYLAEEEYLQQLEQEEIEEFEREEREGYPINCSSSGRCSWKNYQDKVAREKMSKDFSDFKSGYIDYSCY